MRWAASRASGWRGCGRDGERLLGMVAGTVAHRPRRGATRFERPPSARPSVASMKSSQRRCVEPATGGDRSPASSASPAARSWNCSCMSDPDRSPGSASARTPTARRLVHAPPRRLGIPLRPRQRPAVEGAHARERYEIRRIGQLENRARLAPSPFQHEQREAGIPRQVRVPVATARDHPPPSAPPPRRRAPAPPDRPPDTAAPRGSVPRAG